MGSIGAGGAVSSALLSASSGGNFDGASVASRQVILFGEKILVLRGTIVNRTYGTPKNPYIYPFLLTTFGPIYYGPP